MKKDGAADVILLAGRSRPLKRDPVIAAALGAGGFAKPTVACVGAANGDHPLFFAWMKSALLASGAGRVEPVRLAGKRSDPGRARDQLLKADIVFMSGGDVEAGMRVLAERGMIDFLRDLRRAGKPFLGISAGSIMLCRAWVRWRDPDDDASTEIFPCLDIAPVLCDTHAEDEGFTELAALLRLSPAGAAGYGIPSGAGLAVGARGRVTALGAPVWLFERTKAGIERRADLAPA